MHGIPSFGICELDLVAHTCHDLTFNADDLQAISRLVLLGQSGLGHFLEYFWIYLEVIVWITWTSGLLGSPSENPPPIWPKMGTTRRTQRRRGRVFMVTRLIERWVMALILAHVVRKGGAIGARYAGVRKGVRAGDKQRYFGC
uniref:Innexin n=1 Tax=Steinernema glaseri TaxID=37863 RepID=A0A1I8ABQ2_9BILA